METDSSAAAAPTTFNILFVCTGNTCRSPMAEALARDELRRRGWRHVEVASAGISAGAGESAAAHAVAAVGREGIDLADHRSRPLTPELVGWADLVLTMSPSHLAAVAELGGEEKVSLLGDFAAGDDGLAGAVRDPFGADEATYQETMREIRGLVAASLDRLAPILHP